MRARFGAARAAYRDPATVARQFTEPVTHAGLDEDLLKALVRELQASRHESRRLRNTLK